MAEKTVDEQLIEKIDGYKLEIKSLKDQVEASQKSTKDIFALDEAKEAIKTGLNELEIQFGEKGVKMPEAIKAMQDQVNKIEGKLLEQGVNGPNKVKSVQQQLLEFIQGEKYKGMVEIKKKGYKMREDVGFDIKTLTTADITAIGTNAIPFSLSATLEPGVAKGPNNPTAFFDAVQKGTVGDKNVIWVERNVVTRGAAMRGENGQAPESSLTWIEKNTAVKKIMDSVPMTNESLEDIEYAMSEIMELLQYGIPNVRDNQIYNGDGTGDNLLGITGADMAKAFALLSGYETSAAADYYDVLAAAALQVMMGNSATDATQIGFSPSDIFLHPIAFHNLKMTRDNDGKFKYPDLWMPNPSISGSVIKQTTRVAIGDFLVGDFSKVKYFTRRGMSIRMWDQVGDDPKYDRVQFIATERGALRIKGPEKFAFVKGTFAAGLALVRG